MKRGWWLVVALALVVPAVALPDVEAQQSKPEPAWCGGSWQPPAVDEKGNLVEPGGTNFGQCVPIIRKVGGKDMAVPTYPAYPAALVIFRQDDKGNWIGGMMVTETGADGKQTTKFRAIPVRVVKAK